VRPVCVQCKVEMRCSKTGAFVTHDNRIWSGDAFRCESCDAEVIVGFGQPFLNKGHKFLDHEMVVELQEE
jgi:hypothetical protein